VPEGERRGEENETNHDVARVRIIGRLRHNNTARVTVAWASRALRARKHASIYIVHTDPVLRLHLADRAAVLVLRVLHVERLARERDDLARVPQRRRIGEEKRTIVAVRGPFERASERGGWSSFVDAGEGW
jgi:hypothetical protein